MGTSSSSRGPGSKTPLIPPGVPPLPPPLPPPDLDPDASPNQGDVASRPPVAPPLAPQKPLSPSRIPPTRVAPPRRFASARTNLGKFARSGSTAYLRKGLGHYTKTGLDGARAATQRMGRTAATAGGLYGILDALRSGTAPAVDLGVAPATLAGRPAREVADRIANALQPADGTQDAEAARDAISRALSELIASTPDIDLLALAPEQIDQVVESYVAFDLCHRIELDVGRAVLDKAATYAEGMQRLEEMKAYIRQEVARCFRARATRGQSFTRHNAASLAAEVLRDTFNVFEEYVR